MDFFSKSDEEREAEGKQTRENFEKYYQWHLSGSVWENYFDQTDPIPLEQSWGSNPRIIQSEEKLDISKNNIKPSDLSRWLITNVLREPDKLGTFMESRLTRDLTYKQATSSTGGMYFNESSAAFDGVHSRQPFNFDVAYDQMKMLCERRNQWERARIQRMQQVQGMPK